MNKPVFFVLFPFDFLSRFLEKMLIIKLEGVVFHIFPRSNVVGKIVVFKMICLSKNGVHFSYRHYKG